MLPLSLIPQPSIVNLPRGGAHFVLTSQSRVVVNLERSKEFITGAQLRALEAQLNAQFREEIASATGLQLEAREGKSQAGDISIRIIDSEEQTQAVEEWYATNSTVALPTSQLGQPTLELATRHASYSLSVTSEQIRIVASHEAGVFYALQTLWQLMPPEVGHNPQTFAPLAVPRIDIFDKPRFAYRGIMVDIARSFLTLEELKELVNSMSKVKLNVLHLHLADDQGWRIEITNEGKEPTDPIDYTNLTKVSGQTAYDWPEMAYQGEAGRTGFLTQVQYRELVEYARTRFVEIIPEIDVPGHCNAILRAIPELNDEVTQCKPAGEDKRFGAAYSGGAGYSYLNPDNPLTFVFFRHVIRQLIAMDSQGTYIHIGGHKTLNMVKELGKEAYVRFVSQAAAIVHEEGRKVLGWSETSAADVQPADGLQHWVDYEDTVRNAIVTQEAKLVASQGKHSFLDQKYTEQSVIGLSWCRVDDYPNWYNWDPALSLGEAIADDQILGLEAPLWSETVRGRAQAEWLMWPRALASAEVAWTPQQRRILPHFQMRVAQHGTRLTFQGTNFFDGNVEPWQIRVAGYNNVPIPPTVEGCAQPVVVGAIAAPATCVGAAPNVIAPLPTQLPKGQAPGSSVLQQPVAVVLDWGDGQRNEAVLKHMQPRGPVNSAGLYLVEGHHTYAEPGRYEGAIVCANGKSYPFSAVQGAVE